MIFKILVIILLYLILNKLCEGVDWVRKNWHLLCVIIEKIKEVKDEK